MICQSCGVEAPTRKVLFVQHIGAIVMFFHRRIGMREMAGEAAGVQGSRRRQDPGKQN